MISPGNAEVLLKAQKPTGTGGKVERKEYEALLVVIEQTIETSISRGAENFRGYRRDTHPHGLGRLERTARKPDRLYNGSDVDSGDPDIDAIGRLYRNCFNGRIPEDRT